MDPPNLLSPSRHGSHYGRLEYVSGLVSMQFDKPCEECLMKSIVASGITTSIILETILLRRGADQLSWPAAARTAMGMSMVSMLAMETAENLVDYHLTGGMVNMADPMFWTAAATSIAAGYLAPLPYNYLRLRKYGRACH